MKKIRIIADVSATISRWVDVDDDFDPATCNIKDLFWKSSENITEDDEKAILDDPYIDPWKIEDEDGKEIYAD